MRMINCRAVPEEVDGDRKLVKPITWYSVSQGMCLYKFNTMQGIINAYEAAKLLKEFWNCDFCDIDLAVFMNDVVKDLVKYSAVLNSSNTYGSTSRSYSDPINIARMELLSANKLQKQAVELEVFVENSKRFGYTAIEEKFKILTKMIDNLDKATKADKILSAIAQIYAFVSDNKSFKYWEEFLNNIRPTCIAMLRDIASISMDICTSIEGGVAIEQEVFVNEDLLRE